jgi:hypothetical protein
VIDVRTLGELIRHRAPVLLGVMAIGIAGCGGSDGGGSPESASTAPSATESAQPGQSTALADIASVDQLRARFNTDEGKTRLLLLLSPT